MKYQTITVTETPTPIITLLGSEAAASTFVNNDIAKTVYIGSNRALKSTDSDVVPVPPLGSAPLDTATSTYAVTKKGTGSVQCLLVPGTGGWTAAPSQIQASLNALGLATESTQQLVAGNTADTVSTLGSPAQDGTVAGVPGGIFSTGVPLYSKSQQFASRTNQVIAAGGVSTIGPGVIPQIGYEIGITVKCQAGATKPFLNAQVTWFDSVSGLITSQERWSLSAGSSAGITYYGSGPTKGDTLEIDFTNPDSISTMTYSCVVVANSRPYMRDDWRQQNLDAVPGFSNPNYDGPMNLLAAAGPTIASGANTSRLIPLYAGRVFLSVSSNSSAGFVQLTMNDPVVFPSTFPAVYSSNIGSGLGAGVNDMICLPRAPCTLFLSNTGASSSVFNAQLVIEEY